MKDDNIQLCCVFGKAFIKPLRKIMKMTVDELFHNVLTELVFFEKVIQLRKHIHSSTFNSVSPMLNFLFEGFMLLFAVRMLKIRVATTNSNRLSSQKYKKGIGVQQFC